MEHILWQNVDQRQVEMALTKTTAVGSGLDRVKIDILGYLLREIGYRSQGKYTYVHTCTFINTCVRNCTLILNEPSPALSALRTSITAANHNFYFLTYDLTYSLFNTFLGRYFYKCTCYPAQFTFRSLFP